MKNFSFDNNSEKVITPYYLLWSKPLIYAIAIGHIKSIKIFEETIDENIFDYLGGYNWRSYHIACANDDIVSLLYILNKLFESKVLC